MNKSMSLLSVKEESQHEEANTGMLSLMAEMLSFHPLGHQEATNKSRLGHGYAFHLQESS